MPLHHLTTYTLPPDIVAVPGFRRYTVRGRMPLHHSVPKGGSGQKKRMMLYFPTGTCDLPKNLSRGSGGSILMPSL